jgi:hypothetical protein
VFQFFVVIRRFLGHTTSATKPIPGTLQEGGAPFQTTHWTVVLQAARMEQEDQARKALADFSEAYWPPLYTFVRRRGYSPSDAQDLVQGFFEHLLEHHTLSRADQEKGRLRTIAITSDPLRVLGEQRIVDLALKSGISRSDHHSSTHGKLAP